MAQPPISVLIIARPGPLRESLRALMTTMPQISVVAEANDVSSASRMAPEPYPALVFVDSNPTEGQIRGTIGRIKARWPQAGLIFLANDVNQQQEARAAGADEVLLRGFPAVRLIAIIVKLLPQQGASGRCVAGQPAL